MASESIGSLHLQFKSNVQGFTAPLRDVRRSLGTLDRGVREQTRTWRDYAKGILGAVAAYKSLALAARGLKASLATAIEFERQEVALEALVGNAEKARQFMDELLAFSLATPFTFKEMLDASKQMLAFNFAVEEVLPNLAVIGKAAAATGQNLADAVFPFAQARTEFKQVWRDIRQFTTRGLLSLEDIAAVAGVTRLQIRELSEEGKLSFPIIAEAMKRNAEEGGRFADAMARVSESTFGLVQRFKDLGMLVKRDLGEAIIEVFNLREMLKSAFGALGDIVTTGKFKAAMVTFVELFRDTVLNVIGKLESGIRSLIQAMGKLVGAIGLVLSQLPEFPFIGQAFKGRTLSTQEVQERFGIPPPEPIVIPHPLVDAGRDLVRVGEELSGMTSFPSFADALRKMLGVEDQQLVTKTMFELWGHIVDRSKRFVERIRELGAQRGFFATVRENIPKFLNELVAKARSGFRQFDQLFIDLNEMLDKAQAQIAGIERPPKTLRQMIEESLGGAEFAGMQAFDEQALAIRERASALDDQRLILERQKMLWEESLKIIEATTSPMDAMRQSAFDLLEMQQRGWITEQQRLKTLNEMAVKLFDIADVEVDPFKALAMRRDELKELLDLGFISLKEFRATLERDREKILGLGGETELRPFSEFRFAAGPLMGGRVRGADTPSLLRQQTRQQDTMIDELTASRRVLDRIEREGLLLRSRGPTLPLAGSY